MDEKQSTNVLTREVRYDLHNRLREIIEAKKDEQRSIDKAHIDYTIINEEISDAEVAMYYVSSFGKDVLTVENKLRDIMSSTTSGRIHDTLGELFPDQHVKAEPIQE